MKNRKWMQKLNRFAMSSVAAFALMVVGGIANRSCYWYFGQDELPEGAKKLRRFQNGVGMVQPQAGRAGHHKGRGLSNGMVILLNLFTTQLIGIFSGHLLSAALFTVFFMLLRSYSGGYHSDSRVFCYLVSSAVLLIPVYTSEVMTKIPAGLVVAILLAASAVIFILSPMDSPKRKLDAEEKRHFGKKARLILFAENVGA